MVCVLKYLLKFYGMKESPNKFFVSVSNPPVLSLFKTGFRFCFFAMFFLVFLYSPSFFAHSEKQAFFELLAPALLGAAFSLAISIDVYCPTLVKDIENDNFYFKLIEKIFNISIGSALFNTINKSNTIEDVDRLKKKQRIV